MSSTVTHSPPRDRDGKASIFVFAATVLALVIGVAFGLGWLVGRILL